MVSFPSLEITPKRDRGTAEPPLSSVNAGETCDNNVKHRTHGWQLQQESDRRTLQRGCRTQYGPFRPAHFRTDDTHSLRGSPHPRAQKGSRRVTVAQVPQQVSHRKGGKADGGRRPHQTWVQKGAQAERTAPRGIAELLPGYQSTS